MRFIKITKDNYKEHFSKFLEDKSQEVKEFDFNLDFLKELYLSIIEEGFNFVLDSIKYNNGQSNKLNNLK